VRALVAATAFASLATAMVAGPARADRAPVAVVWLGEPATLTDGARVAEEVQRALSRSKTGRGLDGAEDRRLLIEGGPVTRAAVAQARGEALLAKLKCGEAVRDFEAAERILLEEVPIAVTQARLGAVERSLLVCYDNLGRAADAARAAERLSWTAGTNEDVAALIARHHVSRAWQPSLPPVRVVVEIEPTVAPRPQPQVYRNLQPVGVAPVVIPGGDPTVDAIDVEAPGYRRVHRELGRAGGDVVVQLVREDRLGLAVDELRASGAEPPAEAVADVGKRVGAERVLVLSPDGPKIVAHVVDVKSRRWASPAIKVDAEGQVAMERLAGYASPPPAASTGTSAPSVKVADAGVKKEAPPPPKKSKWGSWGKWYTWVAAGAVVLLVGGLLIAQNVGSDSLTIQVRK
jgi:hypothetical protein